MLERTQYMYRAQSFANYPFEAINAADLPGVLWYLHHEVVQWCPRHHDITRVMRLKVTIRKPPQVPRHLMFSPFTAIDNGTCTTPNCDSLLKARGYSVGCQTGSYAGFPWQWYSLPKEAHCECNRSLGTPGCNYHIEYLGEIILNELSGITNLNDFCRQGLKEYNPVTDRGYGTDFWDGFNDPGKAETRMEAVLQKFREKYPEQPDEIGPSHCGV